MADWTEQELEQIEMLEIGQRFGFHLTLISC